MPRIFFLIFCFHWILCVKGTPVCLGQISKLSHLPQRNSRSEPDWLIDSTGYRAGVYRTANASEIAIDNGLIHRRFRVAPNGATVAFENLMTGESILRGVKPEALVTLDGKRLAVGGLNGQPNYAYLLPEWLDAMNADESAMQFIGFEVGPTRERLPWKRVRHHATNLSWPPRGISLRMDYRMPVREPALPLGQIRKVLWKDDFRSLKPAWKISASRQHPRTSFENEGKPGEVYTLSGFHCFAERTVPRGTEVVEAVIDPGTDRGISWGPGLALVFEQQVIRVSLRSGDRGDHGHFEMRVNGTESLATVKSFQATDGGLDTSQRYRIRAARSGNRVRWMVALENEDAPDFQQLFETEVAKHQVLRSVRVGKMDRRGQAADDVDYPGELGRCRIMEVGAYGTRLPVKPAAGPVSSKQQVTVSVHYELYDGLPALSKWITVRNGTPRPVTVDRFTSEVLAVVEQESRVETRDGAPLSHPRQLHVETDFAFGGMSYQNANRHVVHWRADPQYTSQVNYLKLTPCLLEAEPTYGPAQTVAPGDTFESFRTFELAHDSPDRERRGLALRRFYRTVAPWVTENPLMHHLLNSNPQQVRQAIDQAAEVGFEMIILSFGSGFNMDNESPEYLTQWKEVSDYAQSRGIEIGSYSLLSSRSAPAGNMIVSPDGQRPTHGRCPALTSPWGQAYFKRLKHFYETTGFDLLEHDGSYPGDVDVTPRPPLQKGEQDSRWAQWRTITDYYKWCRERGIYLNVPDYYFLSGANKTGMGYREVNWSLPRAMQVIHTRQNIFDGTWNKTPGMGWMFVPLAQYHGGGEAATVEPLDRHIDHYRRMIDCNLALGVQACYRGPRLFDTQRTKTMLKQRVDWFLQYRDILESDLIHGRRADGRDLDWVLHVNPQLPRKGMLIVFNPLKEAISRKLKVNLYYTGLTDQAKVTDGAGRQQSAKLNRDYTAGILTEVPAEGMSWYLIE
ncbi:MAG: hypothetical protein VX768_03715 [Planctomycetota bacterium]|nr:hypothetical protein [Planctomycetota bacterium]